METATAGAEQNGLVPAEAHQSGVDNQTANCPMETLSEVLNGQSQQTGDQNRSAEDGKKRKVALHVAYIGAGYAVSPRR